VPFHVSHKHTISFLRVLKEVGRRRWMWFGFQKGQYNLLTSQKNGKALCSVYLVNINSQGDTYCAELNEDIGSKLFLLRLATNEVTRTERLHFLLLSLAN
jgi:hypothetical protein